MKEIAGLGHGSIQSHRGYHQPTARVVALAVTNGTNFGTRPVDHVLIVECHESGQDRTIHEAIPVPSRKDIGHCWWAWLELKLIERRYKQREKGMDVRLRTLLRS